jgi:hypothetical protein
MMIQKLKYFRFYNTIPVNLFLTASLSARAFHAYCGLLNVNRPIRSAVGSDCRSVLPIGDLKERPNISGQLLEVS